MDRGVWQSVGSQKGQMRLMLGTVLTAVTCLLPALITLIIERSFFSFSFSITFWTSMHAQLLSCVQLPVTLWTVAHQDPPSQARILGWPTPSPADLPNPGIKPGSPALQVDSLPAEATRVAPLTLEACAMKELGVIFYNCSCLVLDLQRIFALYSSLKFKSRVPQTWSKRLYGVYDNEKKLQLQLNETKSQAFVSNSPKLFCPKNRSFDIDAIYSVIDDAKQYVYIAVMDYLPISSTSTKRTYWPDLDGKIREALVLRSVKVRLLISFWKETDPLTFNFISSLKAICTEIANCSLKVKFFDLERENVCITKEQRNHAFPRLNRNKYMVTDGAAYIGNFDWVGNDFTQNAGTGLVINQADVRNNTSIIKQLKDVFERDWYSPYARSLQPAKQPNCSSLFRLRLPSSKTATCSPSGKDP
ncbi:hypothetical protein AB1E18_011891 [Capra hircus]